MKNLKGDIIWALFLLAWILILVIPASREIFMIVTSAHPYMGGFVKFAVLASMGDLLGARIIKKRWIISDGFIMKAVLWGIIGMMITLVFSVFVGGTIYSQEAGKLPFANSNLALAFFASLIMNTTFGPMMYIYHKFGELFIDLLYEKKKGLLKGKITVLEIVSRVDWNSMVSFSWIKTCSLLWIPCHTLVFLMPPEYRVLVSAFLSIVLGIIIAFSKIKKPAI